MTTPRALFGFTMLLLSAAAAGAATDEAAALRCEAKALRAEAAMLQCIGRCVRRAGRPASEVSDGCAAACAARAPVVRGGRECGDPVSSLVARRRLVCGCRCRWR